MKSVDGVELFHVARNVARETWKEKPVNYKETKKLCVKGCGRERRDGQRDCRECHAETMRNWRAKKSDPVAVVERVTKQLIKKRPVGGLGEDYRERLEARAVAVKAQIDAFNDTAMVA
jgi:hypothetical protein